MPERRWWLAGLIALFCFLTPALPAAHAGPASRRADQAASRHLYIMFIPGLCAYPGSDPYCHGSVNAAARARATFWALIRSLSAARIPYTPLYYSYRPGGPAAYTVNETHQAVPRSVDALELQLRAVWKRDPSAAFDLVGHSLGGVVAASWAVSNGRMYGYHSSSGLLHVVNSIVTYDSPVRGLIPRYTNNIVTRLLGGRVIYSLQPDSETIKEITFFSDSWWRTRAHLHSIANSADEIVPPPESLLGDRKLVLDGRCNADIFFFRSCHGAVLSNTGLNTYVACHWITVYYACSPRPGATATATRTPLPAKTPAATPRPVFTPTATPTLHPPPPP